MTHDLDPLNDADDVMGQPVTIRTCSSALEHWEEGTAQPSSAPATDPPMSEVMTREEVLELVREIEKRLHARLDRLLRYAGVSR